MHFHRPSRQLPKRVLIFRRDGWRCAYCARSFRDEPSRLTLDHLVPRSRGGSNSARNLVAACAPCNEQRGNRPITEWLLLVSVDVVAHAVRVVLGAVGHRQRPLHRALRERVAEIGRLRAEAAGGPA